MYDSGPPSAVEHFLMDYAGFSTALVFDLKKESPFSFKCQVCSACCYNKAISVTPYEVLRLARNVGLTTAEFLRTCTEEGETVLRNRPDGGCIFLASRGCGVHRDRPLVCRLFPLGQIADQAGREKYASMPLHPDCLGHFDADGTVASYLDSQGAEPYFRYDTVYAAVYKEMLKKGEEKEFLSTWLDGDGTVTAFCRKNRRNKPQILEEVVSVHLEALEAWLATI